MHVFTWKKVGDEYQTKVLYAGEATTVKLQMDWYDGWLAWFDSGSGRCGIPYLDGDKFACFRRDDVRKAKAAAAKGMMKLGMVAA